MRVPEGFRLTAAGSLVRCGYESRLPDWVQRARTAGESVGIGGRGGLARAPLDDGAEAFVRRYRHGGLLGTVLGEAYFGRPPRPWRELVATEAARRAGVVAPEVLAAVVEPFDGAVFGVPYRGVLVTRGLEQRRTFREALLEASSGEERLRWLAVAAAAVRQLHTCGVRHPDLNVTNLLVGDSLDEKVAVIDFDRAVAGTSPVGWVGRRMAHRRLSRSIGKLGLPGLSRAQARRELAVVLEAGR
ncbi:MAG: lipopolysaccharide kinase InaA family protein [Candidatus Binatia bacterium]|nr:lipopolysaccharide kinase InaA family protein [Candidatus Binatia bacterium]